MTESGIRALTFDVFGTVVDWRGGIIREARALGQRKGIEADWEAFADGWRSHYHPSMDRVRRGEVPWTKLDDLHRASLVTLLAEFGFEGLDAAEIDHLNFAWHRLDPWPDSVPGLLRLKQRFILATMSNGNVSLLVDMAKRAGLFWDAILGAEVARHYKRDPETYLVTADLLGLISEQCLMVAAHNEDLKSAQELGFRAAFVCRPREHGPSQSTDLEATGSYDFAVASLVELAAALDC